MVGTMEDYTIEESSKVPESVGKDNKINIPEATKMLLETGNGVAKNIGTHSENTNEGKQTVIMT